MNDCAFCGLLGSGNPAAKLPHLVLATPTALALVNRAPLTPGHLTLVFAAHNERTSGLADADFAGVGGLIGQLSVALENEFSPQRVILLGDGKRSAHLHWHLLPEPAGSAIDLSRAIADLNQPVRPVTLGEADTFALVTRLRRQLS